MLRLECSCQNSEDDLAILKNPSSACAACFPKPKYLFFLLFLFFLSFPLETNIGKVEKKLVTKGAAAPLSNLIIEPSMKDLQRWILIQISDIIREDYFLPTPVH